MSSAVAPAGVTPLHPPPHRVSFTPSGLPSPAAVDADEVRRQYGLYRSAPAHNPSYDRLRFVRLPEGWVPESRANGHSESGDGTNGGGSNGGEESDDGDGGGRTRRTALLRHWPALVYPTIAELVRDLPRSDSGILKARLIVEHHRRPDTVVARLVGWDGASASSASYFPEGRLEMVRLSSPTIGACEEAGELEPFYERQFDMEEACAEVLRGAGDAVSADEKGRGDDGEKDGGAKESEEVVRHAARFMSALDVALNILALDVGADPLPPRPAFVPAGRKEAPSNGKDACARGATATPAGRTGGILRTPGTHSATKSATESAGQSAAKSAVKTPSTALRSALRTPSTDDAVAASGDRIRKRVSIDGVRTRSDDGEDEKDGGNDIHIENDGGASNSGVNAESTEEEKAAADAETAEEKEEEDTSAVKVAKAPSQPAARERRTKSRPASRKASSAADRDEDAAQPQSSQPSASSPPMPWKDTWAAMRSAGWTWKGPAGLMTDYHYIKPGKKVKTGTAGVDYFTSESDAVDYAARAFGHGVDGRGAVRARIAEHARHAGESVPPLLEGVTIGPDEGWRSAWDKMLRSGWRWRQGSGLMMDYYYLKPGRTVKGGKEGEDYFCNVGGVQEFARRNYGWRGEGGMAATAGGAKKDRGDGELPPRRARSSRWSKYGASAADEPEAEEFQSDPEPDEEDEGEPEEEEEEESDEMEESVASDMEVLDFGENEMREHDCGHPDEEAEDMEFHGTDEEDEEVEEEEEEDAEPEESDDDDESRFSDRSTYSETGFEDKRLFPDERDGVDADVPPLTAPLDASETWSSAWKKMRSSGWTWKAGTGLMTDYYYVKPGRKVKTGSEGDDYFTCERDVRRYAARNYGWRGPDGRVPGSTLKRRRKRKDSYANRSEFSFFVFSYPGVCVDSFAVGPVHLTRLLSSKLSRREGELGEQAAAIGGGDGGRARRRERRQANREDGRRRRRREVRLGRPLARARQAGMDVRQGLAPPPRLVLLHARGQPPRPQKVHPGLSLLPLPRGHHGLPGQTGGEGEGALHGGAGGRGVAVRQPGFDANPRTLRRAPRQLQAAGPREAPRVLGRVLPGGRRRLLQLQEPVAAPPRGGLEVLQGRAGQPPPRLVLLPSRREPRRGRERPRRPLLHVGGGRRRIREEPRRCRVGLRRREGAGGRRRQSPVRRGGGRRSTRRGVVRDRREGREERRRRRGTRSLHPL